MQQLYFSGGVCIPGNLVGCMETEFDCADRDWLGMDPLKDESADAEGTGASMCQSRVLLGQRCPSVLDSIVSSAGRPDD